MKKKHSKCVLFKILQHPSWDGCDDVLDKILAVEFNLEVVKEKTFYCTRLLVY